MRPEPLLAIRDLTVSFPSPEGPLTAVAGLGMDLPKGAITCLVGESGSGKSLACRAILRLEPEYAVLGGSILFDGQELMGLSAKAMRAIRGSRIAMIFQEPMTSLNPVLTVGAQTAEPLRLHLGMSRRQARRKVIELFTQVGIPAPEARYHDYPHLLSGGLRQRVMIAMALACEPMLLLADEPTTALDVTIQGQILRLIKTESRQRAMAVLLITHDLGVVAETGDYVGVIYAGVLMEYGSCGQIFQNPLNPYTQGLMLAQPSRASATLERLPAMAGSVPPLAAIPKGCPFQPRCPRALPVCAQKRAPMQEKAGHQVACWLYAT